MIKRIICFLLGHKKYSINAIEGADIIEIKDVLGNHLVGINVCSRCGAVYSDYPV